MADSDDPNSLPTQHWSSPDDAAAPPTPPLSDSAFEGMLGARGPQTRGGWQPPTPEELQARFPQYEITALLGRGGMGAVYKGWQRSLERFVAIKILPPGLIGGEVDFAARFKREAKAMAKLKHAGIIPVHDAGETADGLLYFVMDFVEGTDVHKMLATRGRLPAEEALPIISRVLDALAYAHKHGIIHRDIKPANIMVDEEGNVQVADFGLARSTAPDTTMLTMSNMAMGTPDFMAPESHLGMDQVDHRADLYAVGVMLYQMLTGKLPRGRFDPPSKAVPGLDKRLDRIVDRTLQPERDSRYSSAVELRSDLEPVATRLLARRSASAVKAKARNSKPMAAIAGIGVLVLGVGAILVHHDGEAQKRIVHRGPEAEALKLAGNPDAPKSSTSQVSQSSTTFPPGKWVKPFSKFEDIPVATRNSGAFTWKDGWIDGTTNDGGRHITIPGTQGRNFGIRLHGKMVKPVTPEQTLSNLFVRQGPRQPAGKTNNYQFVVRGAKTSYALALFDQAMIDFGDLKWAFAEQPLKPGDEFDIELYAIGDQLIARYNGKALPTVTDTRLTAGEVGFHTLQAVRDVEVINLDGLPEAEALKLAGVSVPASGAPPQQWKRFDFATMEPDRLRHNKGSGKEGDTLHLLANESHGEPNLQVRNGAVRATVVGECKNARVVTRMGGPEGQYFLSLNSDFIDLNYQGAAGNKVLKKFPIPARHGEEDTFQLASIGTTHAVWWNGQLLGTVEDASRTTAGSLSIQAGDAHYKSMEYINLDGLPEPEALKLAGGAGSPTSPDSKSPASPPGPWSDMTARLVKRTNVTSSPDGWLKTSSPYVAVPDFSAHNAGFRCRFRGDRPAAASWPNLTLREVKSGDLSSGFQVKIGEPAGDTLEIYRLEAPQRSMIKLASQPLPAPMARDEEYTLEIYTIGQTVVGSCRGQTLAVAIDREPAERGLGAAFWGLSSDRFKDCEVINLDGLPEAEALNLAGVVTSAPTEMKGHQIPAGVQTFAGHRYRFIPGKIGWAEAKAKAEAMGGHLATITSKAEDDWIVAHFGSYAAQIDENILLGGVRQNQQWTWITGEPFAYSQWLPGQPSDAADGTPVQYWRRNAGEFAWDDRNAQPTSLTGIVGYIVEWDSEAGQ